MSMAYSQVPYAQLRDSSGSQHFQNNFIRAGCKYPEEAPKILGKPSEKGEIPLVVSPENRGCMPFLIVPEGTWAIPTNQARYLDPWAPGCYWAHCFIKLTYLVTTQNVMFKTRVNQVQTQDNALIDIEIAVILTLKQEKLREFIDKLGADQLDEQLRTSIKSGIKDKVREFTKERIYTIRNEQKTEDDIKQRLQKDFEQVGVEIKSVFILNVILEERLAQQLENSTIQVDLKQFQLKQTEFTILKQKNIDELKLYNQTRNQDRSKANEEFKKIKEDTERQYSTYKAETQRILTEIQYSKELEVGKIIQEAEVYATMTKGETEKQVVDIVENAKKRANEMLANAKAYYNNMKSQTEATVAQINGQILEIQSKSEKEAFQKLETKRKFELERKKIQVIKQLAQNKNLLISSGSDGQLDVVSKAVDLSAISHGQAMAKEVLI